MICRTHYLHHLLHYFTTSSILQLSLSERRVSGQGFQQGSSDCSREAKAPRTAVGNRRATESTESPREESLTCYLVQDSFMKIQTKAINSLIIAYDFSLAPSGSRHSGTKSTAGVE